MLTKEDYVKIKLDKTYFVEYEFNCKKSNEIMDGYDLLEIENCGYDVLNYHPIFKALNDKIGDCIWTI